MKSIFSRLLITYFIVVLMIIVILTSAISFMYKTIVMEEKKESFQSMAKRIGILTEKYAKGAMSQEELNAVINGMSYSADAMIYVIQIDKESFSKEKNLKFQGFTDKFVYNDLSEILKGNQIFRKNQYSEKLETYVAYMGYPLKINAEIKGAILMFCPIYNINQNIMRMNLILWTCGGIIFLMSVPFIFINSRRISKPIEQVEIAARTIAKGERTAPVMVHSKDELGMLAHSFNNMKEQLEMNDQVRREFIANVSHELRTPLTSIGGFVQGMLDGIIPMKESTEYLKIIHGETKRLEHLTSDLLDMAKIQSGVVELKIEEINLYEIVSEAILLVKDKTEEKHIKVKTQVETKLKIAMDRERLMQILINLLNNAVKFSKTHGSISISAAERKHLVVISITDTGIGIPQQDLPFIFDKFYRSNKEHSSERESSGLGLSIVKNLVVLSGGNIWAQSKEGQGTNISFTVNKVEG
ncbi:sensor histidine kinase [Aminipila terrae]|uniref:histidine kinase n=1 Tax=Aminipila terrae TaxID=2697030 RepID=A0A6P1MJ51_9FIRM|nr:HAMP domain-containing sensor histidine kinase [Aminipila terrae]QHI71636.1 HAMP domain-containing protein [Aminipila terrae]